MLKGSCLCGAVKFKCSIQKQSYVFCHCNSCKKASGSAFGANVSVNKHEFELISGEQVLNSFESSPGKHRYFCRNCGSPIYTLTDRQPDMLRVRLGSLDSEFTQQPAAHIFVAEKAGWFDGGKEMPEFGTWPDPDKIQLQGSLQEEG